MGARSKLNAAYLNGSLMIAGLVGWVAGSFWWFVGVLAVMVGVDYLAGNLRPRRRFD